MTNNRAVTEAGIIEYSDTGKGMPLLFIHGGHSNSKETLFHKGFDKDTFRLITPSRPGYGQTPLTKNGSAGKTAALFISLLDKLHLEKVIVIGISAGGLTAIEITANYPERVSKLILISAVTKKWLTNKDDTYKKGKILFNPALEKYTWWLYRSFFKVYPKMAASLLAKELSKKVFPLEKPEIEELYNMVDKQRSKRGFVNDLNQDIPQGIINKITSPTLILHSLNDNAVCIEHAKFAANNILRSLLKTYNNNWGHLLWLGQEGKEPIADTLYFINN